MTRNFLLFLLVSPFLLFAQLQSPSEFLGYPLGSEFSRHADIVSYFEHVAANSSMVQYADYGKTNERRRLTYAVVSSAENIANQETIRTDNLKNIGIQNGSATPEKAIVWLSYNVHGNEASSSEAAMNTIYKLITEHTDWLQNTVVIIDPGVNPDGRDRYVNWYNQQKATPYNASQLATEHHEPWPGGRPNHYLFDLNRDWMWATQVETQQRLKIYNQWMPQIHVDFHEQGINEPYYFAPAAEPFNEIITPWQHDFQTQIGKNHGKYFDNEGWLYFTRERFDLLYPSYGDTYPMFMGAIGMTYEQAGHGFAGLGVDTDEGPELTLLDRLTHHSTTGLSTIEMASKNAAKLNSEFKKFFKNDGLKYKSFVLKGNPDNQKALTELLDQHQIKYGYSKDALVISTNQPKGKMAQVLFEPNASLSTPLTYDITAWNLAHAYGLEMTTSPTLVSASEKATTTALNQPTPSAAGYIMNWSSMDDAEFLSEMLQKNIKVRFSEKELSYGGNQFGRGSLVITRSDNKSNSDFDTTVCQIANAHNRKLYASPSSFADSMTDFGSPDIKLVNKQRIAMLQGEGTSSLSYGALWHFFETELKYPITSINTKSIGLVDWSKFDVLIMPEGYYASKLKETEFNKIEEWINKGGKAIAIGSAVKFFKDKKGFNLVENTSEKTEETETETPENYLIPYDKREIESTNNFITGSIFKVSLDETHPLAFGYGNTYYSLKKSSSSYKFLKNGYNVGYIQEPENVSGFAGETAKAGLKNSIVFAEARKGQGCAIYMVDDVLFRSFWQNGKLFLVNAIFYANHNLFEF